MTKHFYQPSQGHGLAHNPFNSIVAPRPIGWISSAGESGVNLAPYSFFNAFNYTPPIVGFASIGYKDSVANIAQKGEFCWNLVSQDLVDKMNITSAAVSSDVDEFELAGLDKGQSTVISVPHVKQAKVVFECRATQTIQLQDQQGENLQTWLVLGEVVGVHIDKGILKDGIFDTVAAKPVMRGGGPGDYFTISELQKFELLRPK